MDVYFVLFVHDQLIVVVLDGELAFESVAIYLNTQFGGKTEKVESISQFFAWLREIDRCEFCHFLVTGSLKVECEVRSWLCVETCRAYYAVHMNYINVRLLRGRF